MKKKKLKFLTTFLLLLLFFVVIFGTGCGQDDINDYDPTSIIGKWKLIKEGSCIGEDNLITEITPDSILKTYINDEFVSSSSFRIKKGETNDTIFLDNKDAYAYNPYMFIKLISSDTLWIYTDILTLTAVCTTFKRIK